MSILTWIRAWKKKGRTIEKYDKRGRLRVLCAGGGNTLGVGIMILPGRPKERWARCPECDRNTRVTGPKYKPRFSQHNAVYQT